MPVATLAGDSTADAPKVEQSSSTAAEAPESDSTESDVAPGSDSDGDDSTSQQDSDSETGSFPIFEIDFSPTSESVLSGSAESGSEEQFEPAGEQANNEEALYFEEPAPEDDPVPVAEEPATVTEEPAPVEEQALEGEADTQDAVSSPGSSGEDEHDISVEEPTAADPAAEDNQPANSSQTGNSYVAEITPNGVVGTNKVTEFTATFTELSSDTPLGSARLLINSNFNVDDTSQSIHVSTSSGKSWSGGLFGYFLELTADDADQYLGQDESVSVVFKAKTPDIPGTQTYDFVAEAWTDNLLGGGGVDSKNKPDGWSEGDPYTTDLKITVSDTIQGAIDAPAIGDGDTIAVAAGDYFENIIINKELKLSGAGQENTIIYPAFSAPDPGGAGSLPPGSSNVIIVQADNVTICDLTVDGDNPNLTSVIVIGGADIDARNGIITNHTLGTFNNLEIYNTTVRNIYMRGIYPSSGGTFNIHHNIVDNVGSNAIMNWAGAGIIAYNMVSNAPNGITSNHSKGTEYLNNYAYNVGIGIHSDNNVVSGDLIQGNIVENAGYGILTFYPNVGITVENNTINNSAFGLTALGSQTGGMTTFTGNIVDGQNRAGSTGAYVTTDLWGHGTSDVVRAFFQNNIFKNLDYGFSFENNEVTSTITSTIHYNDISNINLTMIDNSHDINNGTIDASGNWWGTTDPTSVVMSGPVDFTPMLASGIDTDPGAPGFQPDFSTLIVHTLGEQVGTAGRIQEGINEVAESGTVNVEPGTYVEVLLIEKPVQLLGAGKDVTFIDGDSWYYSPNELYGKNLVTIQNINSGNVLFDGFTLKNAPWTSGNMRFPLVIRGCKDQAEITVTNNAIIAGANEGWGPYWDWGVYANNTAGKVIINNNLFDGHWLNPVLIERALGDVEVGFNAFKMAADGGPAIFSMSYGDESHNVVGKHWYHSNEISAKDGSEEINGGVAVRSAYGQYYGERQFGSYTNLIIEKNIINNLQSSISRGISLSVDGPGGGFVNPQIMGNTIIGPNAGDNSIGIQLLGDVVNPAITGNFIQDMYHGIRLGGTFSEDIYPKEVKINNNIFNGNIYGVFNAGDQIADARFNWWGDASGPSTHPDDFAFLGDYVYDPISDIPADGTGDSVSENVHFSDWLIRDPFAPPPSGGSGGIKIPSFTIPAIPMPPLPSADPVAEPVTPPAVTPAVVVPFIVIIPEPLFTVEFVTEGTLEDLAKAWEAYEAALQAFEANRDEMTEEEIALHELDQAVALAAILTLELVLETEGVDLDAAVEAYLVAMELFEEHSNLLSEEQLEAVTAVLEAIAARLASFGAEL